MTFERARNTEQKNIRIQQIKEATLNLFDTKAYHEISLATIAKELHFTRANLYKYISTKEEIFLLIMHDEITQWLVELETAYGHSEDILLEEFVSTWARVTSKHARLLKLFSILFTVLEQNASIDQLVAFKNEFAVLSTRMYSLVKKLRPKLNQTTIDKFLMMQLSFAIGLYPLAHPSDNQIIATKKSNYVHSPPDFTSHFEEFLTYLLKGLES